jgi:hypothetical protein
MGDPEEEAKIIERVGNMRRQKNMTKTGRGRGRRILLNPSQKREC